MNNLKTISKRLFSTKYLNKLKERKLLSSSATSEFKRQSELFEQEKKRQKEAVGRIEKIEVQYEGAPENTIFVMNKNVSTPYDCATHLGEKFKERSVVALLNGETLWHLHKPLPEPCKLELLHYHNTNPASVNKTFWRSCSFLLGAVVKEAFKDNVEVHLHSFPSPNVRSGSFVYDVQLSLDDWKPTESELKVLSIELVKFCRDEHRIETLDVAVDVACEIFKNNPHKTRQIPDIAAHHGDKVTLFRAGPHVDISRGPMVPDTGHLGRVTVTNVLKLETDIAGAPIYRFQGVALPRPIIINHFAYGLIEERGRNLNAGRIPGSQGTFNEDNSFAASITN